MYISLVYWKLAIITFYFDEFFVDSLVFSTITIMSSANKDSFVSSFPIHMPFISFSCLICYLGFPVWCWIRVVRTDSLGVFLILFLVCWEFLPWMGIEFCPVLFLHLLIWSCDFFLSAYWFWYQCKICLLLYKIPFLKYMINHILNLLFFWILFYLFFIQQVLISYLFYTY